MTSLRTDDFLIVNILCNCSDSNLEQTDNYACLSQKDTFLGLTQEKNDLRNLIDSVNLLCQSNVAPMVHVLFLFIFS